jgi:DNA-binding NarL/FixJ family response regulator
VFIADTNSPESLSIIRGDTGRRTMVLVAEPGLLMECLAETLRRRFPEMQVATYANLAYFPVDVGTDTRLILFHHQDKAQLGELIRHLKKIDHSLSIGIVINDHEESDRNLQKLAAAQQIDGVLPLNLRLDVFLAAIDLLIKGGEHFPSALLQHLSVNGAGYGSPSKFRVEPPHHPGHANCEPFMLTTREVEILDLVCKGTQNKIIAGLLKLSENTVKVHIRNIYKKMHVRNRTEAASRYFDYEGRTGFEPSLR